MSELIYNPDYFMTNEPKIYGNEHLREPQISAYRKVHEHFIINNKETHAIVILPTGVGKTGLIGFLTISAKVEFL